MPTELTPLTRQLQVRRGKVKIGRGTLGFEMIGWLIDVAAHLERAWIMGYGDQDAMAKHMLSMWIKSTIVASQAGLLI